jgi:hypothetical protein
VVVTCTETSTPDQLSTQATCSVTVKDAQSPVCTAPPDLTLECDGPGGVDGADVLAALGTATAGDNCAVDPLEVQAPELFAAGCAPGAVTPVTWIATDTADPVHQGTCSADVTVQDSLPPTLTPPAPLVLECSEPGGVSLAESCELQLFLASAVASDLCHQVSVSEDAPAFFPAACGGAVTPVSFTATDECGLTDQVVVDVTVADTLAPEFVTPCALAPAAPQEPSSPASPGSAEAHLFVVACGEAEDLCASEPVEQQAELLVSYHEVVAGECEPMQESVPVECGEMVELVLLAPPCPSNPPATPPVPLSENEQGQKLVTGETIELVVTATDACLNAGACTVDATTLCELPAPDPPPCDGPLCGE